MSLFTDYYLFSLLLFSPRNQKIIKKLYENHHFNLKKLKNKILLFLDVNKIASYL